MFFLRDQRSAIRYTETNFEIGYVISSLESKATNKPTPPKNQKNKTLHLTPNRNYRSQEEAHLLQEGFSMSSKKQKKSFPLKTVKAGRE